MRAAVPLMVTLGLISLLYGAFTSLTQVDAKRIVAYSSLSHLGLILIAIFSFDPLAIAGAVVYIVAHGLFSAALFLSLGYVEAREETRSLQRLGGLAHNNPRLGGALMLAALAALGLPGLAGFAGELLILTGLYHAGLGIVALVALIPIVIAAGYMLRLFQNIMDGPKVADLPERRDLSWIEGLALAPLVIGFVLLGIDPAPVAGLASDAARVLTGSAAQSPASRMLPPRRPTQERAYAVVSPIR
jgi:NADH-quinone oxidoreductase subunit M